MGKNRKRGLSVLEMEKELGVQDVEPIILTNSDSRDRIEKNEDFSKWYNEELRELFYKKGNRNEINSSESKKNCKGNTKK